MILPPPANVPSRPRAIEGKSKHNLSVFGDLGRDDPALSRPALNGVQILLDGATLEAPYHP